MPNGPTSGTGGYLSSNYHISFTPGSLTINPRPITITANAQSKFYGTALSLGTSAFTVTGSMANSEVVTSVTLTSLSGKAASTTAPVGTYTGELVPNNPSGGTGGYQSSNYQITFLSGTLTVISWSRATMNLQDMVDHAHLDPGIQSSLDDQLQAAAASFAAGDTTAGVNQLQAFINHVSAQSDHHTDHHIDDALADAWIMSAQQIIDAVG